MSNTLYQRITENYESLGRAQQKAANWLIKNTHRAVFMSVKEIAQAAEVGDATVHRLFMDLGYSSFYDARKEMQQSEYNLRTLHRLERSQQSPPSSSWMKKTLEVELSNLQLTFTNELEQNINNSVDLLMQAKKIYVVGWKMTTSVAYNLYFSLNFVFGNVILVESPSTLTEHLSNMDEHTVLIALQFPRYSPLITKLVRVAKEQQTSCILFSDSSLAPSAPYSDVVLVSTMESPGFLDSYVTPLLISQMILQVIAHKQPQFVKERLQRQEKLFQIFEVFKN